VAKSLAARRLQGRVLDPARVVATFDKLQARVNERFPHAGLATVCADLALVARETAGRARSLSRPYYGLRILAALTVIAAVGLQVYAFRLVDWSVIGKVDAPGAAEGLQAAVNLAILAFGALWFLITAEQRLKRRRTLNALFELRSFAHVIDMHQLTKDPTIVLADGPRTASSPERRMTEFELSRYLDYCAEMLALIAKLAALYANRSHDEVVFAAVNEVENLTSNLGRKIWQKIMILSQLKEAVIEEGVSD
jgi:hypothetical protein